MAAILAAISENMQLSIVVPEYLNSTYFASYEWTLHLSLRLKEELRYIRIKFLAAILADIMENIILLLEISTYSYHQSFIPYELTLHLPLYLKAQLRYITRRFKFSAAILAAILENMQLLLLFLTYLISPSFILYESTLYSSLYLKE